MPLEVDIKTAASRLHGNVSFLQPLYECITNSMDANASNLKIVFTTNSEEQWFKEKKINGYAVTDDGDGFTDDNFSSFSTLWSDHKRHIGSKGVGRLTWIKVFRKIHIESTSKENYYNFDFTDNFDAQKVKKQKRGDGPNQTIISLQKPLKKESYSENLKDIKKEIIEHLLAYLYLRKMDREMDDSLVFPSIRLELNSEKDSISENDIPKFKKRRVYVRERAITKESDSNKKNNEDYKLDIYFYTKEIKKKSKLYYCANGRTVKEPDKIMGYSLKDFFRDGFHCFVLVCGKILDEYVNDGRTDFEFNKKKGNEGQGDIFRGVTNFEEVERAVEAAIDEIVLKEDSKVENIIKEKTESLNKDYPHLIKYVPKIKAGSDVSEFVKKANSTFFKESEEAKDALNNMLKNEKIDQKVFNEKIKKVTSFSASNLAHYVVYRYALIKALEKIISRNEKKEDPLHELFYPMREIHSNERGSGSKNGADKNNKKSPELTENNIWLLDDKYMSYNIISSDKDIKEISEAIAKSDYPFPIYEDGIAGDGLKRPDLLLFFSHSQKDKKKDLLIVEFKAIGATQDRKEGAIMQVGKYINVLREKMPDLETSWAYIITTIDEELARTLEKVGEFKPLFSNGQNNLFYKYNREIKLHTYVIEIGSIASDAKMRNQTFLSMITDDKNV